MLHQFHEFANSVHVASHLWRELPRELLELSQLLPYLHLPVLVQQHRKQSLCPTGILYRLCGEEQIVRRRVVEATIFGGIGARLARRVLEEEYDAVDLASLSELVGLERYELFELHVLDAKLLY